MKRTLPIIIVLALVIAGVVAYKRFSGVASADAFVRVSGRVEGTGVAVAARAGGRVAEILVGAGEPVTRGQVVARLEPVDAEDVAALGAQARQRLAALEARLRAEQAELGVIQTRVPLAIRAGEANVNLTQAVLQQCENAEDQHRREVERLRAVEEPDDETRLQLDQAELAHEQAQQDVVVARAAVERAESDLQLARLGQEEIGVHIQEVEALRSERDGAQTALEAAVGTDAGMPIIATIGGLVSARHVTAGTHVAAGTPLIDVVTPDSIVIRAEVSAERAKVLTLGQQARIYLDGAAGESSDSRITGLAASPSGPIGPWTVSLAVPPGSRAVLGMHADVVIRIRDDAPWPAQRR